MRSSALIAPGSECKKLVSIRTFHAAALSCRHACGSTPRNSWTRPSQPPPPPPQPPPQQQQLEKPI
ncbi:hypothetical protein M433DRAFT_153437 [Acidomyces richmondensis BFW]|nr:MAG: hypothetical protein FE78DRAFT_89078 [Acidomyces sp. 'richmondensis']KYG46370.1 hypothetical protein M433DRAFT_153437 [Acidomyces richmondensis BFW]